MSIEGKVILITGAATGIGRALAAGFTRDGADVIGFDINRDGLVETEQSCCNQLMPIVGDVTSEADVDRLVTTCIKKFGHIDVLFNNAGIPDQGALLERPFPDWARVIEVNLIGVALCTHRVLPSMLERRYGRIINVVSRAAESAAARLSAYASSKAGVITFTKAIANNIDREQYPDVLINAMIPGMTRTPIWARATESGLLSEERLNAFQEPELVYPHARFIIELQSGGPSGRVFFNSQDYPVYQHFNEERQ
jgi:NAD(P)-dependent dehydrogenase (short-subunit alcohol dehydrogenase family)